MNLEFAREQGLKIGTITGNSYHPRFWRAYPFADGSQEFPGDLAIARPHADLVPVSSLKQNLLKVAHGRVDLTIASFTYGRYTTNLLQLNDQVEAGKVSLYSKRYPVAFVKNSANPDIQSIYRAFDRELKVFKGTEEYRAIFAKWLSQ